MICNISHLEEEFVRPRNTETKELITIGIRTNSITFEIS